MKILQSILIFEIMMNWIVRRTVVRAFQASTSFSLPSSSSSISSSSSEMTRFATVRLRSTRNNDDEVVKDDMGRRVRQRSPPAATRGGGWDDDDDVSWNAPPPPQRGGSDGWDDFDPFENGNSGSNSNDYSSYQPKPRRRQASSRGGRGGGGGGDRSYGERPYRSERGGRGGGGRGGGGGYRERSGRGGRGRGRGGGRFSNRRDQEGGKRVINMSALEGAGFVHLYGLSSVLNALKSDRRDLETSVEKAVTDNDSDDDWDDRFESDDDDYANNQVKTEEEAPKPEAQFRPYLFVQQRGASTRKGQKASTAEEVIALAEERDVPIAEVDKGVLNALSGNRPHQGFVLRCGHLDFEPLSRIPIPGNRAGDPSVWLVLDEVVDPQNLGALLRSAYFLGGGHRIGVLVCSKNSAPPTPVVSASSAGALEVLTVYSTSNLPRTLNQAREDGFRIIGASSSVPRGGDGETEQPSLYDLQDLPVAGGGEDGEPVLLVLGSEGHGLRTLVAKACSEFVRIPAGSGGDDDATGVDSLNVSVTGGILLWQILNGGK